MSADARRRRAAAPGAARPRATPSSSRPFRAAGPLALLPRGRGRARRRTARRLYARLARVARDGSSSRTCAAAFPEATRHEIAAARRGTPRCARRRLRRVPGGLARVRAKRSAPASASSGEENLRAARAHRAAGSSCSRRTSAAGSSARSARSDPGRADRPGRPPSRQSAARTRARPPAHALRQPPDRRSATPRARSCETLRADGDRGDPDRPERRAPGGGLRSVLRPPRRDHAGVGALPAEDRAPGRAGLRLAGGRRALPRSSFETPDPRRGVPSGGASTATKPSAARPRDTSRSPRPRSEACPRRGSGCTTAGGRGPRTRDAR